MSLWIVDQNINDDAVQSDKEGLLGEEDSVLNAISKSTEAEEGAADIKNDSAQKLTDLDASKPHSSVLKKGIPCSWSN